MSKQPFRTVTMDTHAAADRLAALGHETRLAIYRMLVQAGTGGMNAGVIGARLALAPATLSFHLAHLSRVGLVSSRPDGRFIYYAADYAAMNALLGFLTANCCQGKSCAPETIGVPAPKKRKTATV